MKNITVKLLEPVGTLTTDEVLEVVQINFPKCTVVDLDGRFHEVSLSNCKALTDFEMNHLLIFDERYRNRNYCEIPFN